MTFQCVWEIKGEIVYVGEKVQKNCDLYSLVFDYLLLGIVWRSCGEVNKKKN